MAKTNIEKATKRLKNTLKAIELTNELYNRTHKLYTVHETKEKRYDFLYQIKELLEENEDISYIADLYIEELRCYNIPTPECLQIDDDEELSKDMRFVIGVYVGNFKDDYTLEEAP